MGLLPESRLARSLGVPVDEAGFIAAGEDCLTPIPGIFAAGDLRAKEVRQLTTACARRRCGGPWRPAASVFDAGPPSQESVQAARAFPAACAVLFTPPEEGEIFPVWAGSQETVHPMERRPPVFRRPPGVYLMAKVTETVTCCSPSSPPCATQ